MLGFELKAYIHAKPHVWLATWEAYTVRWLNGLVEHGTAQMIQDYGGYPSVWTLPAIQLDQLIMLIDTEPKLVRDTLDLKTFPGGKLRVDISPNLLRMSFDELVNTTARVVAWDQS